MSYQKVYLVSHTSVASWVSPFTLCIVAKRTRNAAVGFVDAIKQRIRGARAVHLGGIRSLHEIVQRAGQLFEGAIREGIAAVERLDRALRGSHEAIEELERTSRQLRDQAQTLKNVRARDSKALERD